MGSTKIIAALILVGLAGCDSSDNDPILDAGGQTGGGSAAVCDLDMLRGLQACIPLLTELAECHAPDGTCQFEGGLLSYRFENGSKLITDVESGTVTSTYYGPGEVLCGKQIVRSGDGQAEIEMADGRTIQFMVDIDAPNERVTYGCTDGSQHTVELATVGACFRTQSADSCDADPNAMIACDADAQCREGDICCGVVQGFCMAPEDCSLVVPTCTADADCTEAGELCCPSSDGPGTCSARQACVDTGWCGENADCGAGSSCCDNTCAPRPFCEGECQLGSGGCADGGFCCAPEGHDFTRCTDSVQACFGDNTCAADTDCGAGSGLVCCPGGDGSSCQTVDECYNETACTAEGDACPAGTQCCLRFGPEAGFCGTEFSCRQGNECTASAECGAGGVCCRSAISENPTCFGAAQCAQLDGEALP